jgi:outer membrane protein OmpA-like peptidoglycan-associated protein
MVRFILIGIFLCLGADVAVQADQITSGTRLAKKKLPATVNSAARELAPMISADGRTLYFTRETKDVDHQTIWHTERRPDGSWGPALLMPAPLNNETTTFLSAALPDNNTLLVGGTFGSAAARGGIQNILSDEPAPSQNKKPLTIEESMRIVKALEEAQKQGKQLTLEELKRLYGLGGQAEKEAKAQPSDDESNRTIALTHRTATGWSVPEYLRIKRYYNVASRNDFFLAPGNKALILSIQTYDTQGVRDLYISFQQPDGTWSEPENLRGVVNSEANEISPFIAADGKSLYFASDRTGGFGGYDIYLTRRLDESWRRWSPPRNLGPEINTDLDEANLTVDASGSYAFMSQGKKYEEDIYEFALPSEARPTPVAFVQGICRNPSGKPVAATVDYERLKDGAASGSANAHPETGRYQIALAIGEDYAFRAQAPQHIPVSERLDLRQAKESQVLERDLVLVPIQVGAKIRLNNVFFEFAKSNLLLESKEELDRLIATLNQHPNMEIEIAGHTDNIGDSLTNQKLSEDRAAAVKQYLLDHGVAAARLKSKGYGKTMPVVPNDTEEHRQLNRRVEFIIIKM